MRPKSFNTAEIRELVQRLRTAAKHPEIRGRWEGMAHHTLGESADALEYLLQFIEWKPIGALPPPDARQFEILWRRGRRSLTRSDNITFRQPYYLREITHYRELPPPPQEQEKGSE